MAVKITATGIDTIKDGSIEYNDMPSGSVLQVVNYTFTGTNEFGGYAWHATSIVADIVPKYTNSKILVWVNLVGSVNGTTTTMGRLYRNDAVVSGALGNAAGSRPQCWFKTSVANTSWNSSASATYIDSPNSTSNQRYRLHICPHDSRTVRVNYNWSDSDANNGDQGRGTSSITLMEIKG